MLIYMLYENVGKVGHGLCPLPLQTIPVFLKARRHIGQVEEKQKKRKKDDTIKTNGGREGNHTEVKQRVRDGGLRRE